MRRFFAFEILGIFFLLGACVSSDLISTSTSLRPAAPITLTDSSVSSGLSRLDIDLEISASYARFSVYKGDALLVDNLNIPKPGRHSMGAVVQIDPDSSGPITVRSRDAELVIHRLSLTPIEGPTIPRFNDISETIGLEKVSSIKYGGPTVADLDNDGDYDFILNNHNQADTKLYWNNGDGTVTPHTRNLSRWFMHDLHGTAPGDFDGDGDLDLVVTQGGGNGTNPSKANFYTNNDGTLVLTTGDVGIDRGGRGRGARWSDMDMDGDLDLLLFNEEDLSKSKPQHFFFENTGDGTFDRKSVPGIEDIHQSRVLVTDLNMDQIDDFVFYAPLSVWLGNGDFTYTDATSNIEDNVSRLGAIMAIADVDIDNDGDLDLYLARGKALERIYDETPSMDFDPLSGSLSLKPRGLSGTDLFEFAANGPVRFSDYFFTAQGHFRGQEYPIYLGAKRTKVNIEIGDELDIRPRDAAGWPDSISENGMYFGHLGGDRWKAALVRNGNLFWAFKFTLIGIDEVTPEFVPQNRNESDVLLRNDGGKLVDVSNQWNLPEGGNALGVTAGDFNNDGLDDVFVYRWGLIESRISDVLLLNTGMQWFEPTTMHGASDVGGPGNGDMGQAFDFDLDGDLDLLSGSEGGEWYLYENAGPGVGNHVNVRVDYAPNSRVDPMSALVTLQTPSKTYHRRVGSAGEVFSQSLLNTVHFGLGDEDEIERIEIRWRNGETVEFLNKVAGGFFDTNRADPLSIDFAQSRFDIRQGASYRFEAEIEPVNADRALAWSSSDDEVLSVGDSGLVTARGAPGQSATVTAVSEANGLSVSALGTVTDWHPIPVESVAIEAATANMVVDETLALTITVLPKISDHAELVWESDAPSVATVAPDGIVTALSPGIVKIQIASPIAPSVKDSVEVRVAPLVEPYLRIVDAEKFASEPLIAGDTITVEVEYHAGTGNEVIASDEGGIRFWLRHFQSKWFPVKDIVLTDARVVGTTQGSSSMEISLDGLIPTSELPEGHFYQLRASFAASDGRVHDQGIFPLEITRPADANE